MPTRLQATAPHSNYEKINSILAKTRTKNKTPASGNWRDAPCQKPLSHLIAKVIGMASLWKTSHILFSLAKKAQYT